MRVALSVDALSPQLTGIGRYAWELARGVPLDPRVRSIRFFSGSAWVADPANLIEAGAVPRQRPWQRWKANVGRAVRPPDIIHAPNYFLPDWGDGGVATIHDLSVFRFPETHPAERIAAFEARFARTIQRARLLLTDCEWIRRELIAHAGLAPERVVAVPLGVAPEYRPRGTDELTVPLGRLGLIPGQYGLCVSTVEPRKRIDLLLAAWRILPLSLRRRFPLVLAGASGWQNAAIHTQIEDARREGWLHFPGFVPEADLPLLYAGARVFAYPSLYEGFGLPPLEAMASGVPTIVASHSCLAEVTAGGAIVLDVTDVERFAEAIRRAIEDEDSRAEAISSGSKVASGYSWHQCVSQTVDAYALALG